MSVGKDLFALLIKILLLECVPLCLLRQSYFLRLFQRLGKMFLFSLCHAFILFRFVSRAQFGYDVSQITKVSTPGWRALKDVPEGLDIMSNSADA